MKKIILPKGEYCTVDDADYLKVSAHTWYLNNSGYASAKIGKKFVLMHRMIMRAKKGEEIDHKNGNKLDNRKTNLRFCNRSQNLARRSVQHHNSSGYKGVCFDKISNKFRASIQFQGKHIALGRFEKIKDAASAYNIAALKYFGEFAQLNEV